MNLRKWMALLLAVVMAFGLAACGNKAEEEDFSQEPYYETEGQDQADDEGEFKIPI